MEVDMEKDSCDSRSVIIFYVPRQLHFLSRLSTNPEPGTHPVLVSPGTLAAEP